jgi:hypothetical protein
MKIKDIKLNQWYDISHMFETPDAVGYMKVKEILYHDKDGVNLVTTQINYTPRSENENTVIYMGSKLFYHADMDELDNLFSKPIDQPNFMPCVKQFCSDNDAS